MKKALTTILLIGALSFGAKAQFNQDLTMSKRRINVIEKYGFDTDEHRFLKNWVGLNRKDGKNPLGNYILSSSLLFASGFMDGTAETLKFHYPNFKNRFPNANKQFWDNNISWTNKYKNGNPSQGAKFPLSTTSLVGLTDGYHTMRTGRNLTIATGIAITLGEKRKFKHYLTDALIKYCIYSAGFTLAYDGIFKEAGKKP